MFFSVLIPVYNVEKYLRECLDSVLGQTYQNFELILIDDGSTDKSGEICDEYAAIHPEKIRVIHQENRGLLMARRVAFGAAAGDFCICVDADDYILPNALSVLNDCILRNNCDMVIYNYIYGAQNNKPEKNIYIRPDKAECSFSGAQKMELYLQLLTGRDLNSLCVKAVKRSAVDVEQDYSKWKHVANGEDTLQSLPLVDKADNIVYIPDVLYYYRRDNESMSKRLRAKDYNSFRSVYEQVMEYARKWEFAEDDINKIEIRFVQTNIRIISDIRNNESTDSLTEFMNVTAGDPYIIHLAEAAKRLKVNWYSRLLIRLLAQQKYKHLIFTMNIVEKLLRLKKKIGV